MTHTPTTTTATTPAAPTTTAAATPAVTGFNHVAVLTGDLDRLVAFYCDVLGGEAADVPTQPGANRARLVRLGPTAALVVLEVAADHPHADGHAGELQRGHLDHVGFEVATAADLEAIRDRLVARGASDGHIHDYGALVTVGFTDPDGMSTEVCWLRDPSLADLHHPVPYEGDLDDEEAGAR